MARIRTLHPRFFEDDELASAVSIPGRLLFLGLLTIADRAGRIEDRPLRIKAAVFPYDAVKIDALLSELVASGSVERYSAGGRGVLSIRSWSRYQRPHPREADSSLPGKGRENTEKNEKPGLGAAEPGTGQAEQLPSRLDLGSGIWDLGSRSGIGDLGSGSTPGQTQAVKAEVMSDFDRFWERYPRKVAKGSAEKAWAQMRPPLPDVLSSLQWRASDPAWIKEGGTYIPYPATWLRAKGWLDEPAPITSASQLGLHGADARSVDAMNSWLKKKQAGEK